MGVSGARQERRAGRAMRRRPAAVALAVAAAAVTACRPQPPAHSAPQPGYRVVAYYAAWDVYGRGYRVSDIPADHLTHLIYAFANISGDGRVMLGDPRADAGAASASSPLPPPGLPGGNFGAVLQLKRQHPGLRTLISVGGWSWSGNFSDAAQSPESRQRFAASCLNLFFKRWPGVFDGIDIDWEYPVAGGLSSNGHRPQDRQNYPLLLAELRRQLSALQTRTGQRYLLTAAVPASASEIASLDLPAVLRSVDWLNLMTYDYHGPWDAVTNFDAPLYADPAAPAAAGAPESVDATLRRYRAAVPASKLVLGVNLTAHSYAGVPSVQHGLYQPFHGVGPGTWEPGFLDYRALKAKPGGFQRFHNAAAHAPWFYNAATGAWTSGEDEASLREKAEYVKAQHLGGMMVWEISADDGSATALMQQRLR